MKLTINFLKIYLIFLFSLTTFNLQLFGQEPLPDTVWSKTIGGLHVVKFSPDGQYLFAGAKNDVLKIDASNGDIIKTMSYHKEYVTSIGFSPTGDTVISSGWDGRIVIWNSQTGDTIEYFSNVKDIINSAESDALITPDGNRIITLTGLIGNDKPQILVIDIKTKEIIKSFVGKYVMTSQLNISPDGKYFYFSDFVGSRGFVFLIDLNTYEEIAMFDNSPLGILTPTISPDNSMLASISYLDGKILIYDLKTSKLKKVINYNEPNTDEFGLGNAIFSNDSKYLIFGYYDHKEYEPNNTIVWNIDKDSVEYLFQFSETESIDISKDDYIATVGYTPTKVWHVNLLRPNWKVSEVKEFKNAKLKHSYHDGKLKVLFDEILLEKPEINFYDLEGKLISYSQLLTINYQTGSNYLEIDMSLFSSGIYFVEIIFGNNKSSIKVIKN